jgi:hypothetical protein
MMQAQKIDQSQEIADRERDWPYHCTQCGAGMVHPGRCCGCMSDSDKLRLDGRYDDCMAGESHYRD